MSRGCNVRDDGRPCSMGLWIDEHRLSSDGRWVHPDEVCHSPDTCAVTSCWVCADDNEETE